MEGCVWATRGECAAWEEGGGSCDMTEYVGEAGW